VHPDITAAIARQKQAEAIAAADAGRLAAGVQDGQAPRRSWLFRLDQARALRHWPRRRPRPLPAAD
jgi:hypothetical protein